jgi:hypothetical protein
MALIAVEIAVRFAAIHHLEIMQLSKRVAMKVSESNSVSVRSPAKSALD